MSEEAKKITPTDAIVMMVNAINKDDPGSFYKIAQQFAEGQPSGGGTRYRILNAVRAKPAKLVMLDQLPGTIKNLLIQSKWPDENVFLTEDIKLFIDKLLTEWKNADKFQYHNISVRNKILLYGPTGNGKTTIARHIAKQIELPFVEINSDMVMDSHVGGTSQRIYNLIKEVQQPCVLFWDEIDSIGSRRTGTDSAAGRENDRMVNSILINIEKLGKDVVFIGATNRMEIIDAAFLRRFDVKMHIAQPNEEQKAHFANQLIEYYKLTGRVSVNDFANLSSYAEIKIHVSDTARDFIIQSLTITNT